MRKYSTPILSLKKYKQTNRSEKSDHQIALSSFALKMKSISDKRQNLLWACFLPSQTKTHLQLVRRRESIWFLLLTREGATRSLASPDYSYLLSRVIDTSCVRRIDAHLAVLRDRNSPYENIKKLDTYLLFIFGHVRGSLSLKFIIFFSFLVTESYK